ncbi:WD40 repeat domain-containing protein [Yeosuana sp.]|uniref:WD40 repeat domain-containing protein n=1 Tax=Yeosuana sp. TaxID=2529388 RepID=UPI00404A1910
MKRFVIFLALLTFKGYSQNIVIPSPHADAISRICVSSDGRFLATGSSDGTVKIWNHSTLQLQNTLNVGKGAVYSLYITNDNKKIIVGLDEITTRGGGQYGTLTNHVFKLNSKDSESKFNLSNNYVSSYAELQNDTIISATYDPKATIIKWNLLTGRVIDTILSTKKTIVENIKVVNNKLIISGGPTRLYETGEPESRFDILIYDLKNNRLTDSLHGHKSAVFNTVFNKKNTLLASSSRTEVILWDMKTNKKIRKFEADKSGIVGLKEEFKSVFFTKDDSCLIFISDWYLYRYYPDRDSMEQNPSSNKLGETVTAIPAFNEVVSSTETSSKLEVFSITENSIIEKRKFQLIESDLNALQFLNNDNLLIFSKNGSIKNLNIREGRLNEFYKPNPQEDTDDEIQTLVSKDGDYLCKVNKDSINVWKKTTGEKYFSYSYKGHSVNDIKFLECNNKLTWLQDDNLNIYNPEDNIKSVINTCIVSLRCCSNLSLLYGA